ncbi:MAG TPA: DUF1707 and FHA domain-containing protein [Thermoleophilaceae bacterium]
MSTDAHTPVPIRPSTDDREQVVRVLRDRSVEGRLSTDTFAERVGLAYSAKSRGELAELVSDVRPTRGPRRLLLAAIEWVSALDADIAAAWARPRVPSLALPRTEGARLTVGRSPSCDCVLPEDCVSRRHAELRRDGERWLLRDLGSSNGTRVNGMRVIEAMEVRPGDRLSLGGAAYRLRR